MKKTTIWKSYDLYTLKEEEEFLEFLREEYGDDDDNLIERAYEIVNDYFWDDFGKNGNIAYSSLKNTKCVLKGELGLWDGKHKICPMEFNSIEEAILACMEDSNEIYEDQYGNLCINAYHHDGMNHFVIKRKTDKGLRCVRFRASV